MKEPGSPQFGIPPNSIHSITAKMHRRDFIKFMGGAGALAAAHGVVNIWPGQAFADEIEQRRNVIIFTTDQQQELRWFPPGWEAANLPGLTRLRNKGVSFTRAYTNVAMCTPARTTLFTGLYPAQHLNVDTLSEGMTQSEQEHQLDPSLPNIGTVLQAAGYDVVWKGKWHLSKGIDHPDGTHTDDDISRYGMADWNSPDAGGDAKLKNYGGGTTNHDGRFFDGTTWQDPVGDPSDPNYIFTQADGPVNAEFEAESVMAFLRWKINNPGGNPFCLIICLINPHDVLGCPGVSVENGGNGTYIEGGYCAREDNSSPWSEQTGPLTIEVPPTRNENLLLNQKPNCQFGMLAASAVGLGPVPTDNIKLQYLNFYANLMKLNDKHLVKMLDLLDGVDETVDASAAQALRDNSWIIFLSDHGDMAMAHGGLRQKSFVCYEEMTNIPLVWTNPVDFPSGVECHELVSHVDFLPTLCAILGIDTTPYDFRGVDYSSLIEDHTAPAVQSSILFTFDDIWSGQEASGSPNGIVAAPNRIRALIEKDYKYALYFDGTGVEDPQDEFYDLRHEADGGTDTDVEHSFGSTGKAVEYINYSKWAEDQRIIKKATTDLENKRDQMEADLAAAIASKLTPLESGTAEEPENFKLAAFKWVDENEEEQQSVQVTWMSRCTTQYQLQRSEDMINWVNVGDPVAGNNGPMWLNQQVHDKSSYRLVWSPHEDPLVPNP
ncbi:MAG TPA: sulfatase-like hydrolase/transferase [Kiritimatiellia bacterium]|nr:sulfatase-like hydrolase/transferase [Kiritimatiellia bacterium]